MTWLALAKEAQPRKVVLLGQAVWQVDWATHGHGQQPQFANPAAVLRVVTLNQDLQTVLTAGALPPLGDGRGVPDYRKRASVNTYSTGEWFTVPGPNQSVAVQKQWGSNDEDDPAKPATDPVPAKTWFD